RSVLRQQSESSLVPPPPFKSYHTSELARDGGLSVDIDGEYVGLIASNGFVINTVPCLLKA
ncbi:MULTISPECIES: hypothetical protein, partial [unclassified Pseudomonas]|uniref:hypothetical protein n=1 Tax=unclassified Pseudomonas TaxID=196821 RepID=UPI001C47FB28